MTPCKCVCGAEAQQHGFPHSRWIECPECGWSGPVVMNERLATEAWNSVMGKLARFDVETSEGET